MRWEAFAASSIFLAWCANAVPQVAVSAPSSEPDVQHARILYLKHCAACHGNRAWGDGPRAIPALAGQGEAYLLEQLERFASGQRHGTPDHGPAMLETLKAPDLSYPQAMHELARYLAQAERNPRPDHGDGRALEAGRRAYERACLSCHGAGATGGGSVPRLAGQHVRYLNSQLADFGAQRGDVVNPQLVQPHGVVGAEEQRAVADYLSRL